MLGAEGASGIKTDDNISPQKMKKRFNMLSAKNPKMGCSIFEQICVIPINIVANPIVKPSFAAMNGIIGLINPV